LSLHPDKVPASQRDEATQKFQEIQEAYDTLFDPVRRREYDLDRLDLGRLNAFTPPRSFYDDDDAGMYGRYGPEMPPSPDSTSPRQRASNVPNFDAKKAFQESLSQPQFMSFLEATIAFHPEDRRHLWLCDPDDDPALTGKGSLSKKLHVGLQEYVFLKLCLTRRIFSREVVELTIFRYRYLNNGVKVVEIVRKKIQIKPDQQAIMDLVDLGNEFPHSSSSAFQRLSIVPVDESQLYGENYDGQFIPREGSSSDVEVHHTIYKDDLRIRKGFWSFELDVPALNGMQVTARFRTRLRKGQFRTKLKGQGMWKGSEGTLRGDLYVTITVN